MYFKSASKDQRCVIECICVLVYVCHLLQATMALCFVDSSSQIDPKVNITQIIAGGHNGIT